MNVRVCTMECIYAQTRPRFILSSEKVLGNGVRTHVNSKGKILSTWRLRGGSNPRCYIMYDSGIKTQPTELFRPPALASNLGRFKLLQKLQSWKPPYHSPGVSTSTSWPGVNMLWLDETSSLISSFRLIDHLGKTVPVGWALNTTN